MLLHRPTQRNRIGRGFRRRQMECQCLLLPVLRCSELCHWECQLQLRASCQRCRLQRSLHRQHGQLLRKRQRRGRGRCLCIRIRILIISLRGALWLILLSFRLSILSSVCWLRPAAHLQMLCSRRMMR